MEPKLCVECGKTLIGDFVHLENGGCTGNDGPCNFCISCFAEYIEDVPQCYDCCKKLETNGSDSEADGFDDVYCAECTKDIKEAGNWEATDEEVKASGDVCGGRRCGDCLLKGTAACLND